MRSLSINLRLSFCALQPLIDLLPYFLISVLPFLICRSVWVSSLYLSLNIVINPGYPCLNDLISYNFWSSLLLPPSLLLSSFVVFTYSKCTANTTQLSFQSSDISVLVIYIISKFFYKFIIIHFRMKVEVNTETLESFLKTIITHFLSQCQTI